MNTCKINGLQQIKINFVSKDIAGIWNKISLNWFIQFRHFRYLIADTATEGDGCGGGDGCRGGGGVGGGGGGSNLGEKWHGRSIQPSDRIIKRHLQFRQEDRRRRCNNGAEVGWDESESASLATQKTPVPLPLLLPPPAPFLNFITGN